MEDLKIKGIKVEEDEIPQRENMQKKIIPKHPFRAIFSGPSQSGKTNLLATLLTKPQFYGPDKKQKGKNKNYHDEIYFFSRTSSQDSLVNHIKKECKIPEKNIKSEFDIDMLEELVVKQKSDIKRRGYKNSKKILVILEDVQSDKSFLKSQVVKELYMMGRHYNISIILLGQSFMDTPRVLRMQATNLFIFPCKISEQERIVDEFTPSNTTKKTMRNMISFCTKDRYNFMHINMQSPMETRYRKNLDTVLALE